MAEVVDMLNDDEFQYSSADIYIEPPNPSILTDEDSGDEDDAVVDNLSRNQLLANAEVHIYGGNNDDIVTPPEVDDNNEPNNSNNIPDSVNSKSQFYFPKQKKSKFIKGDLECNNFPFPDPDYSQYKDLNEVEIFEQLFDSEILKLLCDESKNYALFKNEADPRISEDDIKCFLGILILSGYDVKPGKRYYWDSEDDMANFLVKSAMRRDRFFEIAKYIHCANNNDIDMTDKYYKIRPLMKKIKENFMKNFVPVREMNYDESMVKYFGHHGCKQFIRNKPIRFGYKVWCINTTDGYLANFEFYQGKDKNISVDTDKYFGKPTAPFFKLLSEFPEGKKKLNYQFFFDNLFTNQNLLNFCRANCYNGTGTMRVDRLPKNSSLTPKKSFSKVRGTYESEIDKANGIQYIRWMDNSVITVASTSHGVNPVALVRRYSKKEKKYVYVNRPNAVGIYNKNMGGTDLADENISRHRISIRGKKWWWAIFTWLIDASVQNAWILYKKANTPNKCTQLQFRRAIVITYLKKYGTPLSKPGPSKKLKSADLLRYDKIEHFVSPTPEGSRRRCAAENCSSRVRSMCVKCNVGLCISCFVQYHTE